MPNCPKCGNKEALPSRTFTVIVEPAKGERGMTERRVGMYACSKCGTKFPTVISRQKYLIVAEEQLSSMRDELSGIKKENGELMDKLSQLEHEQKQLHNSMESTIKEKDLRALELKLEALEGYVDHLRKEKGELEQRASRFR